MKSKYPGALPQWVQICTDILVSVQEQCYFVIASHHLAAHRRFTMSSRPASDAAEVRRSEVGGSQRKEEQRLSEIDRKCDMFLYTLHKWLSCTHLIPADLYLYFCVLVPLGFVDF